MATNADQPASWIDLASRVRASALTARFLHRDRLVFADQSCGELMVEIPPGVDDCAWARARLTLALARFAESFCLRDNSRCRRRSLRSARRSNWGAAILRPSDRTAKSWSPRSMPMTEPAVGSRRDGASTTNEAKYRPAASLITVTLDGGEGSGRDQRTGTSPIFGNRRRPFGSIRNRALAVNRTACLRSLRERNLGGAILGPLRVPTTEVKKFRYASFRSASACCSTTDDTSLSQERSGVCFAAVSRADNFASVRYGSPRAA